MGKLAIFATVALCLVNMPKTSTVICAQDNGDAARLFSDLQSPGTSNDALKRLIAVARNDKKTRQFLQTYLPQPIAAGPREDALVWLNAVTLAGSLRIPETAPALAKWIDFSTGGSITLAQEVRLESEPAALALAQIGDRAVPVLSGVLERESLNRRQIAVYTLKMIATPMSRKALRGHMDSEPDQRLRNLIGRMIAQP